MRSLGTLPIAAIVRYVAIKMATSSRAGELSVKSLETLILRITAEPLSIATGIIIARTLGPSAKGVQAYTSIVLGLLVAISTGQSLAVAWQYGRLKIASSIVYVAMLRLFVVAIIPLSLVVLAAGIVRHDIGLSAAALMFPLVYYAQTTLAFFVSDGNVRWANLQSNIVPAIFLIFVAIAAFIFHAGIEAMMLLWVLAWAIVAAWAYRMNRKYRQPRDANVRASSPTISETSRAQLGFMAKATLNQLVQILNFQIDLLIVLYVLGTSWGGIYSLAVSTGQAMWHISRPLAVSAFGRVVSGSKEESAELTAACLRHSLFLVTLACAVLFFAGPPLIVLIYGHKFGAAGPALQWILPGIVAYCAMPFLSQFFTVQVGRPMLATIAGAISTVVCVVTMLLLLSRFGIVAGAMGTSASYVASFIFMLVLFQRETKLSPFKMLVFTRSDFRHYLTLGRALIEGAMAFFRVKFA